VLAIISLLAISIAAGVAASFGVRAWPQADPALVATRAVGRQVRRWDAVRRFIRSRLDPETATGLALTVALVIVVATGVIVGVVVYMVRTSSGVVRIDGFVARWSAAHLGSFVRPVEILTTLGSTPVVIVLAVAGSIYGWRHRRGLSVPLFFTLVVAGQFAATNMIKFAVERVRPNFGPIRGLGTPSFPSGHATASAATLAALALVLGRDRPARTRAVLMGTAVGLAVAVACSRVLLGVHWLSDVVSGLLLGWSWFGVCAVSFGGRLLWFGAPAKVASTTTGTSPPKVRSTR